MNHLYLHIGTHKTGSTSIQAFVTMNEAALAADGIYVPRTGRPAVRWHSSNVGHHNVAWELNGLALFSPAEGTFEQLIAEIERSASPAVVVSSEDFEWLHDKPETLNRFVDRAAAIGYSTTVIVYLRAQPEYIQALYTENAKAGNLVNFAAVLDSILEHGAWVTENPPVVTSLRYGPFLDAFSAVVGIERTIVRSYRPGRRPSALLREFLELVGGGNLPFEGLLQPATLNPSPTLLAVLRGLHQSVVKIHPAAPDAARLLTECLDAPDRAVAASAKFDVMTQAETQRVFERFAADNREVARRYGAGAPMQVETDLPTRWGGQWSAVEKQRRVVEAAMKAWHITSSTP